MRADQYHCHAANNAIAYGYARPLLVFPGVRGNKKGSCCALQVYSAQQARSDIDAVYNMGLFDDVNILPQPAEDSTQEQPKALPLPACYSPFLG